MVCVWHAWYKLLHIPTGSRGVGKGGLGSVWGLYAYRGFYVIVDLANYALSELNPSLVDLSPSNMHFSWIDFYFSFIIKIQHALVLQLVKHFDFLFTEKDWNWNSILSFCTYLWKYNLQVKSKTVDFFIHLNAFDCLIATFHVFLEVLILYEEILS